MSIYLYALGRLAFRRRRAVLLAWLAALVLLGGTAAAVAGEFDESFELPGTESQVALESLNRTFPQAGGTSAQVIVVAPQGRTVRDPVVRRAVADSVDRFGDLDQVDGVTSPYDERIAGAISGDAEAAIVTVRLKPGEILPATYAGLEAETVRLADRLPGSKVSVGGEAYNDSRPGLSLVEAVGVGVALVVLLLTLGSLRAAGMPLLTALLGVSLTMVLIVGATGLTTISSTTPLLALMLGLAVGIDYALFILVRHREQLGSGLAPEESAARAVATAGSAVVFAGLTVMIALCGLAVAQIPFLTTMGVAAAVGVAVAVLIALTLLPALLGFAGERLRPRERPARRKRARRRVGPTLGRRWVRVVTRAPVLTVALVVAVLGAMTWPASDLRIALPANGQAAPGTPARTTYDLVAEHFGPGFNGPLIVSATIVGSDDPLGVMDGIADELRRLPGVASVPIATPNQGADTGIVQVVPTTAPDAEETKALVRELRALSGHFEDRYGVPVYVTGYTAVGIDVSDRLGGALVPFGIVVVGLSLLLLAMVFRSVAVPVKATVGYLLSVGAAFGATTMVFEYGWLSEVFSVGQTGPVISFLPILLMGILFGLSMDYEVFLVSRMREEFVHGADRRAAIENGFAASAKVVVAAAVIMFAVFAAFVPHGEGPIKTISFGLAVGVFVDAFAVRMTLVPAVLALLGRSAWWLPRWLDRRLPSFDVEGAGLARQVALADWPRTGDDHLIYVEDLCAPGLPRPVSLALLPGEVLVVEAEERSGSSALVWALSGRLRIASGRAKVAGLVLPEQAGAVRRRTAVVDCAGTEALRADLRTARSGDPRVIFLNAADTLGNHDDRAAVASLLEDVAVSPTFAVVLTCRPGADLRHLIPGPYAALTLDPVPDRVP